MMTEKSVSLDSSELYQTCQSDDEQIRLAAYEALWTYLYRVALQIVHDQPDAQALAQDCAQTALLRVHQRFADCKGPTSFRAWARRIASNLAIDALRRGKRLIRLENDSEEGGPHQGIIEPNRSDTVALRTIELDELRSLLNQAPISDRSRRVVLGRYLDDRLDEELAQIESGLVKQTVLPSHIQVTRSKNISKLRAWQPLRALLTANS